MLVKWGLFIDWGNVWITVDSWWFLVVWEGWHFYLCLLNLVTGINCLGHSRNRYSTFCPALGPMANLVVGKLWGSHQRTAHLCCCISQVLRFKAPDEHECRHLAVYCPVGAMVLQPWQLRVSLRLVNSLMLLCSTSGKACDVGTKALSLFPVPPIIWSNEMYESALQILPFLTLPWLCEENFKA